MIFYFTGTGNSYYAAKKLAESTGERLINMAEHRGTDLHFTVAEGEAVGFVFPVYFYSVNDLVLEFIRHLSLDGADYVYSVITCGASIGQAGSFLKEALETAGISLSAVYPVVMPDNCLIYYSTADAESSARTLSAADPVLEEIFEKIQSRQTTSFGSAALAKLGLAAYHVMSNTRPFHVTESCIHCGKCAANCPEHAITLKDGVPMWTKKKCLICLSCINRCPKEAIQYGKKTVGRYRYENPSLK